MVSSPLTLDFSPVLMVHDSSGFLSTFHGNYYLYVTGSGASPDTMTSFDSTEINLYNPSTNTPTKDTWIWTQIASKVENIKHDSAVSTAPLPDSVHKRALVAGFPELSYKNSIIRDDA